MIVMFRCLYVAVPYFVPFRVIRVFRGAFLCRIKNVHELHEVHEVHFTSSSKVWIASQRFSTTSQLAL